MVLSSYPHSSLLYFPYNIFKERGLSRKQRPRGSPESHPSSYYFKVTAQIAAEMRQIKAKNVSLHV